MAYTWQVRSWWSAYLGKAPDWVPFMGRTIRVAAPFLPALAALEIVLEENGYAPPTNVGSYFNRNIAGTTKKSIHANGVAVDLDPWAAGNPHFRGKPWTWSDIKFTKEQVAAVRRIRNTNGSQMWRWLGEAIGDTMHWQANVPPWRAEVDWSTVDRFGGDVVFELGKALLDKWSEDDLRRFHALGLWQGDPVAGVKYFKGDPARADVINLLISVLALVPKVLVGVEGSTPRGLDARVDQLVGAVDKIRAALRSV